MSVFGSLWVHTSHDRTHTLLLLDHSQGLGLIGVRRTAAGAAAVVDLFWGLAPSGYQNFKSTAMPQIVCLAA